MYLGSPILVQATLNELAAVPGVTFALHLPGQQAVYFSEQEASDDLRARLDMSTTTLLAFFKYNSEKEDGRQYLYQEFPEHLVYERNKG